ncbi:MAG: hypothetical protein IK116_01585 [Firmicutes bacterium]|nr:hypothetical protein [Bacillota bacterium]
MNELLLSPPIAFLLLLLLFLGVSHALRHRAAASAANKQKLEAYSGGRRGVDHRIAPDYGKFYVFTLIFAIMQVMVLAVATAPAGLLTLPLLYLAAGGLVLLIAFGR